MNTITLTRPQKRQDFNPMTVGDSQESEHLLENGSKQELFNDNMRKNAPYMSQSYQDCALTN